MRRFSFSDAINGTMGRGGARRLPLLLVVATATLPYLPAITEHFVFDDIPAVLRNKDVVARSPVHLWKHDFWGGNLSSPTSHKSYRPLTSLTYWLQTKPTTSPCAVSLKIGNLLVHLTNCLLLLHLLCSPGLLGILHRLKEPAPGSIHHCLPQERAGGVGLVCHSDVCLPSTPCGASGES